MNIECEEEVSIQPTYAEDLKIAVGYEKEVNVQPEYYDS